MKIAIIGAGPAGLSCAAKLAENNISDIDVYEAENQVGGMSKSFPLFDQIVDLGPHRFFSMDKRINDFWLNLTGEDYLLVDRLTRIYYGKKFYLYPVQAMDALKKMGLLEAIQCVFSYLAMQFKKKGNEKNFEEWVSLRFGKKLYSMFFKSYSERLWGIPCTELDADFARQRIKGLNMLEVAKSAIFGEGGKKHKTLVEKFAYPLRGAGEPYDKLKNQLEEKGIRVLTNKPVLGIHSNKTSDGTVLADGVILQDGSIENYDIIVSSAPFTEMILNSDAFDDDTKELAKKLKYRNTTLVYLRVEREDIFKDNWIYVHDPSVEMGRVTNFRNWSPVMLNDKKHAILCLEYWSYDDDPLWKMTDEELVEKGKKDMVKTGLVKENEITDGSVLRMHRSYPVYSSGYLEILQPIQQAADKIDNLYFIGRNGSFKYNNQDHSILMGLMAAENIICGQRKHNLWSINTDYDYQEGESDLVKK